MPLTNLTCKFFDFSLCPGNFAGHGVQSHDARILQQQTLPDVGYHVVLAIGGQSSRDADGCYREMIADDDG